MTEKDKKGDKKSLKEEKGWSYQGLLADTIDGYVSWTIMIYLPEIVFFFPMVKMAFTGWEATFLAWVMSSLVAFIPSWRAFISRRYWLFRLIGISIAFAGFYVDKLEHRIGTVGLGMWIEIQSIYSIFLASNPERRIRAAYGYIMGFVAMVIVNMGFFSINVPFHYPISNFVAFLVGFVAVVIHYFEGNSHVIPHLTPSATSPNSLRIGYALGGVLYLLHLLFSVHSVISRWTEMPTFPHGVIVIVALLLGAFISEQKFVRSYGWSVFGIVSALVLSARGAVFPLEVEFAAGVCLAVFAASSLLPIIEQLYLCNRRGIAMLLGMTIFGLAQIAGIYVVAYKFVPGGEYLRERNRELLLFTVIGTILGQTSKPESKNFRIRKEVGYVIGLLVLFLLSPVSLFRVANSSQPSPVHVQSEIRPLVWAVHFGYNNFGKLNLAGLEHVIITNQANVIGLVETDGTRTVMGNRDAVEWLAESLHMYSDFGPSTAQNTWGCALLTTFPIKRVDRVILPSPEGELACLIDADLEVNGTLVNVLVTHFGNTEDKLDRELQTEWVANHTAKKQGKFTPTVLIGYLTTAPFEPHYLQIVNSGLRDSTNSLDRYCLYILYKDLQVNSFWRVDKGDMSDTEAQIASFSLREPQTPQQPSPEYCRQFTNDSVLCQNTISCGWCQLMSMGSCYEPQQKSNCLALGGAFVGPDVPVKKDVSTDDIFEFVDLQYKQQLKSFYPIEKQGSSFLWTVGEFPDIDFFANPWSSAVFEHGGSLWRLQLFMGRKRSSLQYRSLDVGLQLVRGSPSFKMAEITIVSAKDSQHDVKMNVAIPRVSKVSSTGSPVDMSSVYYNFLHAQKSLKIRLAFF